MIDRLIYSRPFGWFLLALVVWHLVRAVLATVDRDLAFATISIVLAMLDLWAYSTRIHRRIPEADQ